MDKVLERLKTEFASEESRYAYADSVSNAFLTGQIKALREDRGLTQEKLAELVGTQQSGISRWQNSGYSSCKVGTLRKFAKAFGVRLRITFEEFGSLPEDVRGFSKRRLSPSRFEDDPVFNEHPKEEPEKAAAAKAQTGAPPTTATLGNDLSWLGNSSEVASQVAASYAVSRDRSWAAVLQEAKQTFDFDANSFLDGTRLRDSTGAGHVENIGTQPLGEHRGIHLVPKPKPEKQTAEAFNPSREVSAQAANLPDAA